MNELLPSGWARVTIGEVVEVHDHRRVPLNAKERAARPGDFPYYGANGQVDTVGDYLFDGEFVLLAEDGGYFDDPTRPNAYAVSGRFWVNNHAHILRAGKAVDHRFLLHALNSTDLMPFVSGTTRLKLTQAEMRRIPIALPPLSEQRRIVARIERLLGRTRRVRAELERVAPLARRYRDQILVSAFDQDWPEMPLTEIAVTTFDGPFGSHLKSKDYTPSGTRVVRLENIGHLLFNIEKETFISTEKGGELARHRLQAGDVLFSSFVDKEVRVCLFPGDQATDAINKADCFCIRTDRNRCDPRFLAYRLASPRTYQDMRDAVHGATRPRIGLGNLKRYGVPTPSLAEQVAAVARIDEAHRNAHRAEREAERALVLLDRLESEILAGAFKGESVPKDPVEEPVSAAPSHSAIPAAAPARARGPRAA